MATMTARENLAGLIPEPVTQEIIKGAIQQSAVLRMGRRLPNMTSKTQSMNVLDALPMAYWVNGDNGFKNLSSTAWGNKKIIAEEIAVILPIPEAVLDDSNYDIWGENKPLLNQAFGQKIDSAILFGTDKPQGFRKSVFETATDAGNVVTATGDVFGDIMGEDGVIAKVEESGFLPTGAMAAVRTKAKLRGVVDTTGQPIFKTDMQSPTRYVLDGFSVDFPTNGAFEHNKALMIVGDFSQLVFAIRQDITFKILTEATLVNPTTKEILYALAQQDMVALRAVMRLGWEIPNPINAYQPDNDKRCPFAVYAPAATSGASVEPARAAAKAASK